MRVAGASHVSFSVCDIDRSLRWYREVFAAEVMLDEQADHRRAVVLTLPASELLVGLCEFNQRQHEPFDPTRTGLDHFAFSVESRGDLDEWASHLEARGVEHSGVLEVPPGAILNFKDPDGIALALMWRR
jgi:glyoxylase I family protein